MCWLAVHCNGGRFVCLWFYLGIKEGDGPISMSTFYCKLDCWIYAIDMIQKCLFVGLLLDDPCVIHKPKPYLEGLTADLKAFLSECSMYRLATIGLTGEPIATPSPAHRIYFEKKSKYYADRTPRVQWCPVLIILLCHLTFHPFPVDLW